MSLLQPMPSEINLHHDDDTHDETPSDIDGQERQQEIDLCHQSSSLVDTDRDEQAGGSPTRDDNNEQDNENENDDESSERGLETEIMYSIESFGAIVAPVSISMVLSALVVVFVNTEETLETGEQAYANTYEFVDLQEGNSSQNLGASLVNTLVLVSVICAMTFVLVLLYKYRCLKIFYGYMVVVTIVLLGYITSSMLVAAINIYGWRVDKLSFMLVIYNYTVVGTLAIFYQRGIPRWVTQGYLIASSVCLAWQFSYFSDWMAWTLLVMLALYDLVAVLSPCGPLKALAKLISRPGAPQLRGLLYEAQLPQGTEKPMRERRNDVAGNSPDSRSSSEEVQEEPTVELPDRVVEATRNKSNEESHNNKNQAQLANDCDCTAPVQSSDHLNRQEGITTNRAVKHRKVSQFSVNEEPTSSVTRRERSGEFSDERTQVEGQETLDTSNTGSIPLALAKLYNLKVLDPKGALRQRRFSPTWKYYYSSEEIVEGSWTPAQLRSEVTAIFPPRGGVISIADEQKYSDGVTYVVYNRLGRDLRKLVVTKKGKVMHVLRRDPDSRNNQRGDPQKPSTIKLGLGDFVFYSVLVAKAAQYSFTTFAACFLVVLFGLAGTLVILAFKSRALPALPISIGLGVVYFLCTKELIQPWIHLRQNFYV
jgi:hypothetical protein